MYKPPTLIEICGPMFMSYAVAGHLAFRLQPSSGRTELAVRHRVLGVIDPDHRAGVTSGWGQMLAAVKADCE